MLFSRVGTAMSTFVLVHGSWHGAWCWHDVVPRLEAAGHDVVAPDLPAHGVDTTPPDEVTFDDYVSRICSAVDDADEPVVLVGHSMGGHAVTQAAERRSDAIDTLVYLAAFLPADSQSLTDLDLSGHDSRVPPGLAVDEERGVVEVDFDTAVDAFYHDCSTADVALCRALLRPEPIEPRTVPVELTDANYGSVRRAYIECAEDRALPLSFQRERQQAVPCDEVRTLETSHSPFLSAPDALVEALLDVSLG